MHNTGDTYNIIGYKNMAAVNPDRAEHPQKLSDCKEETGEGGHHETND